MKKVFYLITLLMSTIAFSQVGIGTTTPSPKSILDLTATNKGLLLPRLTGLQREGINPTAIVDKGLTVFDTTTNTIWFWNGEKWLNTLSAENVTGVAWGLTGNAGTNPASNYLGTADAHDFLIKANNTELIRATSTGNVGINISTPDANSIMDFNGTVVGSKGVKLPYMSTATRDALGLASVIAGTTMYNTTTKCMEVFIDSAKGWYNPCNNTFSNIQPANVGAFDCNSLVVSNIGEYYKNSSVNGLGYTIKIPYTGGNGGVFSTQTFYSSGVTGLIATLNGGTLNSGNGELVLTLSGTPSASGVATFNFNIFGQTCPTTSIIVTDGGVISGNLTASAATFTSVPGSPSTTTAYAGYPVSGGTATLNYDTTSTGPYNGQNITSTGVLGLTATFASGTLTTPDGTIPVTITGTPDRVGTASFSITVGSKTTTLNVTVTAYVSCNDYKNLNPVATDGIYKIDPALEGTSTSLINCQCDMTTDGGGWTLVLNYLYKGGINNPAMSAQTNKLPLVGSTTLGTDESSSSTYWGHAGSSLMNKFAFTTVRFYGKTTAHTRVIHFKTTEPGMIAYFKSTTGAGSVNIANLINPTYTTLFLPEHTANLPLSANTGFGDQGVNKAMTEFPFYQNTVVHWGISNSWNRWDVDVYQNQSVDSSYHAIWIR